MVLGLAWAMVLLVLASSAPQTTVAQEAPIPGAEKTPVLAYYYIWFSPDSWNRAKTDLPLLGTYSSDDEDVMRQHIRWAKEAGIDGFIVSWKDTDTLSPRLAKLVRIAGEESFKLAINYESLDFWRDPLPIGQVRADLGYFVHNYADNPVFDLFGKPVVIWSGTWEFDRSDIESVTTPLRDKISILASQKQLESYDDVADLVDGNAYYWSSVDPSSSPNYGDKLLKMSDRVHANGGLWIAPAAPGFDARHLGGKREVPRNDGATLITELATALDSGPDAVGLISWNEFSETSHVEPSCNDGDRSLAVLAAAIGGKAPVVNIPCDKDALATALAGSDTAESAPPSTTPVATPVSNISSAWGFDWDSDGSAIQAPPRSAASGVVLLAPLSLLLGLSAAVVVWRSLHTKPAATGEPEPGPTLIHDDNHNTRGS
jgi:hypothetical protein